jgi:hypothetical protein
VWARKEEIPTCLSIVSALTAALWCDRARQAEQVVLKIQPGDVVVFNNRRMLHGRNSFSTTTPGPIGRHLEGCYVNIDEFKNRHEALSLILGKKWDTTHVGNQDHL